MKINFPLDVAKKYPDSEAGDQTVPRIRFIFPRIRI